MTKYHTTTRVLILFLITTILGSCDMSRKYEKAEEEEIAFYLAENSGTVFVKKQSGLYYHESVSGTGATPEKIDSAYVKYSVSFLDGTVLGTIMNTDDTLAFAVGVGDVIAGFDEGITYMKVGGTSKFLIPSFLAYGTTGYWIIPGYSPLLYEVKLLDVLDMSTGK